MNSFFPNVINEWNKLDIKITNIALHNTFESSILSFIRPLHCDTLGIHNPIGLQVLARLRTGLSHLNKHKFKHNFRNSLILYVHVIWNQRQHPTICYGATYFKRNGELS